MKFQTINNLFPFPYNPSICEFQDSYWMAYRWHSRDDWRTELALARLDKDFKVIQNTPIKVPKLVEFNSIEDPRLFVYRDELWIAFVVAKAPSSTASAYMAYGRIVSIGDRWLVDEFYKVEYGRNTSPLGVEKNWVFFAHENDLYAIYGCGQKQTILLVKDKTSHGQLQSPALQWNYGTPIKGGTVPVEYNGKLLRFFHSRLDNNPGPIRHRYFCGAVLMDSKPPFTMRKISVFPILLGDEGVNLSGTRWFKSNVVFPAGCVKKDGKFLLSYGYNDVECRIAEIEPSQLNL